MTKAKESTHNFSILCGFVFTFTLHRYHKEKLNALTQ